MITSWDVYWITRLDGISILCGVTIAISLAGMVVGTFNVALNRQFGEKDTDYILGKNLQNYSVAPLVIAVLLEVFIPSTREAAAIYLLPKIANSAIVREVPDEMHQALKAWLKTITKTDEKK